MTKADLIAAVAADANVTKKVAGAVVDSVFANLATDLEAGNKTTITGFGTFNVVERAARVGRNPQTGEVISIPARKAVTFHAGKALKEAVR
jgi:DNA-binding protein HU-beta